MTSLPCSSFLTIYIFLFRILQKSVPEIAKVQERSVLAVFVITVTGALSELHENMCLSHLLILAVVCF